MGSNQHARETAKRCCRHWGPKLTPLAPPRDLPTDVRAYYVQSLKIRTYKHNSIVDKTPKKACPQFVLDIRAGGYDTSGYAYGVAVAGGYAYVANENSGLVVSLMVSFPLSLTIMLPLT